MVLEVPFVIRPGFSWHLDKDNYLETEEQASLTISDDLEERILSVYRLPGSTTGVTHVDADNIHYEIELPTISCSFGEQSAFLLPDHVWFNAVRKDVFSKLSLPAGCGVLMGRKRRSC